MEIKSRKPRKPRNYFKRSLANSQRLSDEVLETALTDIRLMAGTLEGRFESVLPDNGTNLEGHIHNAIQKSLETRRTKAVAFITAELLLRRLLRDNKQVRCCPICDNAMAPIEGQSP